MCLLLLGLNSYFSMNTFYLSQCQQGERASQVCALGHYQIPAMLASSADVWFLWKWPLRSDWGTRFQYFSWYFFMLTQKAIAHWDARSCGSLVNHTQLFMCFHEVPYVWFEKAFQVKFVTFIVWRWEWRLRRIQCCACCGMGECHVKNLVARAHLREQVMGLWPLSPSVPCISLLGLFLWQHGAGHHSVLCLPSLLDLDLICQGTRRRYSRMSRMVTGFCKAGGIHCELQRTLGS